MTQKNLWPTIGQTPPKTMAEMLYDAAVGLAQISQNKLDFYIDAVGVAPDAFGPVTKIRYNCYIRVIEKGYLHLLFQVTTPSGSPFDAEITTPEDEIYSPIKDKQELEAAIGKILQRERTKEVIDYLLRVAIP
jgi:hypothetical protein